jgi:hypothetical protein
MTPGTKRAEEPALAQPPAAPAAPETSDRESSGRVSLKDWTGYYTITFVVVETDIEATRQALPKGLKLNESYGRGGKYPILVSIGNIENARPRVGFWIGFNYYEVFSAIPGVELEQPGGHTIGPYLYPYRGYLNRLLPVILGRLSGFRKYWEQVDVEHFLTGTEDSPKSAAFNVKSLLFGSPIIDGEYTFDRGFGLAGPNPRVELIAHLLPPNIVGVNPLGRLCRSMFDFRFDRGLAWNVTKADLNIHVGDVIPGITKPTTITYPPPPNTNTILWSDDARYAPFRAFVPWRLRSEKELNQVAPARLMPALPHGGTGTQAGAAAAGSGAPPKPGT